MAIQNEPTRIQIPFADSGTKNVIPDTNSTPSASQAASWTDGFPSQCSLPLSAGGIPPARADFNGILNTMTQSIRYGQEGGVWAWDATVDYGTNRMVLGSDSKVYWSVAQSGPNVGGAQDPTTDMGVYWSAMPLMTPPLADDSSSAATTEWLRDLAVAPVYVDPAGSDSNDGLSASTPKQTLQGAYNLAVALPRSGEGAVIKMAAGSYTGGLATDNGSKVALDLQGNVSVTGNIAATKASTLFITGSSYTFTLTGSTSIDLESVFYIYVSSFTQSGAFTIDKISRVNATCPISITNSYISVAGASNLYCTDTVSCTNSNTVNSIQVHTFSNLRCTNLSISASNVSNYALHVDSMSSIFISSLTISGSSCGGGIFCGMNSLFYCDGDLSVGNILTQYHGIHCTFGSTTIVYGNTTVQSANSPSFSCIRLDGSSTVCFYGNVALTQRTGSNAVFVSGSSCVVFDSAVSISTTVNITRFFIVTYQSLCILNGNITLNGRVSDVSVSCIDNSLLSISSSVTVTGSVTGKRYYAAFGGQILVYGAGASRIPGSIAGVADASSFGYYG